MTVFELIAKLSHYNPNSKVIVDVDKNGDIYLKIDENKIQHKSEIVIQFNLTKEIMEEQIKKEILAIRSEKIMFENDNK